MRDLRLLARKVIRHGIAEAANRADARRWPDGPVAVFIGDSYVAGHLSGGLRFRGWPRRLCREQGWRPCYVAEGGAGFVTPSPKTGRTIGDQIDRGAQLAPDAAVVLIMGGRNDYGKPPADVHAAALVAYRRIGEVWPHAARHIIGPVWAGPTQEPTFAMRDATLAAAAEVGVTITDPISEGWFMGEDYRFVSSDGVHPNRAGVDYLLGKMRRVVAVTASRGQ